MVFVLVAARIGKMIGGEDVAVGTRPATVVFEVPADTGPPKLVLRVLGLAEPAEADAEPDNLRDLAPGVLS